MPFQPGQSGNPKGRPRKAEKYAKQIEAADALLARKLKHNLEQLQRLADGGYERVEEKWLPAALVTTGSGELEQLAFPDKAPDALVLVERKRSVADMDRTALINLIDRMLGKPTQKQEITGEDGGPLEIDSLALSRAAEELAAWRDQMTQQLNTRSAQPTPPTSPTPTE